MSPQEGNLTVSYQSIDLQDKLQPIFSAMH